MSKKLEPYTNEIINLYYDKKISATEIGKMYKVTRVTVQSFLKDLDYDRYVNFSDENKGTRFTEEELIAESKKWLYMVSEGIKLKEIAEKTGYALPYISKVLNKYHKEDLQKIRQANKDKRKINREINRIEQARTNEAVKKAHEQAVRELSSSSVMMSTYSIIKSYRYYYERVKAGFYRLKKEFRNAYGFPKTYFNYIEQQSALA